ncbi:uncharacterized protein LOC119266638 [Triticum dicoccoides]|uniref:uncharacterized protein LOC119266638 n=1 Tax=Triticum dicoccoides TaxID=85692 RepID=UPI00188EBAE7|nr:uncharacterized protein LOC119266638 [Triticum dicoccoides]XP_037403779.1 uncharacterized protein LOC119266638 [Triticum dicoccoides]XP_037403780.1 uncharacterized protein LOC119266638 [Triticum dicoccoides]XP_037403781.1 uncharacterized protein LOC119266638 [Triticum dicoccoides]XP_037403782.1 uncharacterized protein LOC119266638 [Triticum dicoccoides]
MAYRIPKLEELCEVHKLPRSIRKRIACFYPELESVHAALSKVAEVPRDQLDEDVKLWAEEARTVSYNMEVAVDKLLMLPPNSGGLKGLMESMVSFLTKGKTCHQIMASIIMDIHAQLVNLASRRLESQNTLGIFDIVANPEAMASVDPHLVALYEHGANDVATGAIASMLPKLVQLLNKEYKLQAIINNDVKYISREMEKMQAALLKVAENPQEFISVDCLRWAGEVRRLSYGMEAVVDKLLVLAPISGGFKGLMENMVSFLQKGKTRHQIITSGIKGIKAQVSEAADRYKRYCYDFDSLTVTSINSRGLAMNKDMADLVGLDGGNYQELMKLLSDGDDVPNTKLKIVSVVGFGGLGKTTLVKTVYDKIQRDFDCTVFVSAGQSPDLKRILMDITIGLIFESDDEVLDASNVPQLIDTLRKFLDDKRYLIVIDDIWNKNLWENIKYVFPNKNKPGSRIITTTRNVNVSQACCSSINDSVYQMEPLSDDDSKMLLYKIFDSMSECPHEFEQVSIDILKKCGGVPIAIITMASVLAGVPQPKTKDEWHALLKSSGRRHEENVAWRTLSYSYYDLPAHLRTCLLYLSIFPESHVFQRYRLVKKWIAEGIITQKTNLFRSSNKKEAKLSQELSLEETASQYLDELVNRSIIQPLECNNNGEVISYHIHPMMFGVLKVIAIEEKFAASLDDKDISRADPMNFPRLSIDCPDSENLIGLSSMAFNADVHSLTAFGHANQFLLRHFKGTRILDLEDCKSIERSDVEYICSMVLLKQLCLGKTQITELPPEIGNLQYLEGLDVGGTQITQLPTQIGKLKRLRTLDARKSQVKDLPHQVVLLTGLVHLLIGDSESCEGVKLPDGIGNMTSLQQLCTIDLRKCSTSSLKDLGTLPDLIELGVVSSDEPKDMKLNDALLSCLDKSTKLRSLVVYGDFKLGTLQSYSPYKYLNCRKKLTVGKSLKVPIGFAGQSLLVMLDIRVCKLEEDDLKILQELPRLQSLIVRLEVLPTKMIRISCEGFAKLESFCVDCQMPRVIFEEGAMPKLEHLELKIYGGLTSKEHMGIMHLLNLQMVTLRYSKWHATNKGVRETTDAIKTLAREQKNKFTLFIAEEDKDASSSRRTEIEEEEGFKIYDAVANPAAMASTDPAGNDLVGIDGEQDQELMKLLSNGDNVPYKKLKVVSVVGFAGSGKTTLVKTVYDKIKGDFECTAFVVAGQNPELRTVFRDVISQLTMNSRNCSRQDERQLINLLREILQNKRYLIVIDDIWNEGTWEIISYAFSNKNNLGSRIITTTRIVSVSKACRLHANGSVYQMESLSGDNSKKLLYARIFGSVSRGPHEFEQVSIDMLKKCGGVPLAIITMASVLAGDPQTKTKDAWHALLNSIGRGHEENIGWKDMRRTLSYSYYDLPLYLKTCLLYLSTFPVSHPIEKQRLLKKMIVEGIVKLSQDKFRSEEFSLEELASQYLDELVNRNVIHPLECSSNGVVITYHIHPMMHDTLKAIAIEQKFAASFDAKDISRAHRMNFRHLSIDSLDSENLFELSSMAFDCDVQSLTVSGHANQLMLRHFKVRRVLDLESCKSIVRADVKYICRMVLLKHLCLAKTDITELPPEIGNLRHLEGLDVGGTQITQLPPQIGKLKHLRTLDARKSQVKDLPHQVVLLTGLVCLLIGDNESNEGVKLPDGICKMTSLQQLCTIDLRKCSTSSLQELGELSNLREIAVVSSDEPEDTRMISSVKLGELLSFLDKSTKLRSLVFYTDFRPSTLQSSSPYKYLNPFERLTVVRSLKVPIGFTGQNFFHVLDIRLCKLEEDDLKILQELPRLHTLIVRLEVLPTEMIHISCEGFRKLMSLHVDCGMPRMTFEQGAMPNLKYLGLQLYGGSTSEEHMGIKHLLNLQEVTVRYSKWYATNKGVEEITEAVKAECKEHQNKITLCIAEEEKNGICNTKTAEVFQENRVASSSKVTEIVKEEEEDTQEGGLDQSSHDIASCNRTSEIEEVAE